ncbi:MAG: alpha-galactosidase [Clostridia bacterium]|nr:alpha-galactosidase [Clostridia bacterium]
MSPKYCPICVIKKFIRSRRLNQPITEKYNNGVALTPPMGWSSWNLFKYKINEDLIKEIAVAMKESGLAEAGYRYVNIDDCWQNSSRDENGKLQADFITFPSGIKKLNEYVNSLGLKLGIYSSNGTHTCEDYPASLGNERIDADTFAEWGVEYFKYDFCHNVPVPTTAPYIGKISIGEKYGKEFYEAVAEKATLSGKAKLVSEKNIEGGYYIAGLDANEGSAEFSGIVAEKAGKYVLTLTAGKAKKEKRFLVISVNSDKEYYLDTPSLNHYTPEHRFQLEVELEAGENTIKFYNPIVSKQDSAFFQYKLMGKELKRATREYAEKNSVEEKKIVFSICEWGRNQPWKWGAEAGNLWRTTPDITPTWPSIFALYKLTIRLGKYATVGGWNDPDMLEVGNGELTYEENRSHFSLWCMMCAPLILGNDIRKFIKSDGTVDTDSKIYRILTNKNLVSINQDILGIPCKKIKGLSGKCGVDVLVKPLDKKRVAVCVFNTTSGAKKTKVDIDKITALADVNVDKKDKYTILNCWTDETCQDNKIMSATEKHGCDVYIIS